MPISTPHGGQLINRFVDENEVEGLGQKAAALNKIALNAREISDLELIATGVFSPLEGFMGLIFSSTGYTIAKHSITARRG